MFSYCLSPGMYVCASDEGAVLLDLKRDKYEGFDRQQSFALSTVVADWPKPSVVQEVPESEALAFAETLRARGVLSTCAEVGVFVSSSAPHERPAPEPATELMPWHHMKWRHCRLVHVLRFAQALVSAWLVLRRGGMAAAIERARLRKAAYADEAAPANPEAVKILISSWFHIRTLFYAPKGRCLLDSVVLLEFLARYRIFPAWVVGVQIRPFSAHTWLQADAAVLNGTAEYVRAYRPIVVV